MTRRPSGADRICLSTLTCLLLLPLVLASPSHVGSGGPATGRAASLQEQGGGYDAGGGRYDEGIRYRHSKDTSIGSNTASAIATLAPASTHAVRAPSSAQASGRSAGLSSLLNARSLQDWEVEDFILLATVDGSIHARDRRTGAERWHLEVERPMVETIYHRTNRSSIERGRPEDDLLWIVEPSKDGDIYIYNPGYNGGLQRLHLTVKKLAEELSPYAGEDPAVVYTADKKTTLYTVDAGTGIITKVFSSRGSTLNDDQSCNRVNGLIGRDEDECGTMGSLVLGRTEYTIGIQNRDSAEPICTLMYSEWGPNNRDSDLHGQYATTMDQKYVYSRHDGQIFGFDLAKVDERRKSYTQKLTSPVVRVFDVARSLSAESRDTQLVVLPQPTGPADGENVYSTVEDRNQIFINHTETGGWYAMSETSYPLVTGGAAKAQCYSTELPRSLSAAQRQEALVGVHSLADLPGHALEPRPFLTISGPVEESANDTLVAVPHDVPALPSSSVVANSYIIGSAAANALDIVITFVVIVLIAFAAVNRGSLAEFLQRNLEIKGRGSVPSSPVVVELRVDQVEGRPTLEITDAAAEETSDKEDVSTTPTISRRNTLLEPPSLGRTRANSVDDKRGRVDSGAHVRFDLEPSPSPGPEEEDGGHDTPTPGRKKARRGCRGGAKHKKKRALFKSEDSEGIEQAVQEAMHIGETTTNLEPDAIELITGNGNIADVTQAPLQIGHLTVYPDTVLGFGSHGTKVLKGSFGGREVAVKRMLQEFYDIASHEVGLLQESDDHPNVIRYYDKESAGDFLYIALELCPASLDRVIEKPANYPELIGAEPDKVDYLRQITLGLRYLHSLKIVHRDIKPQNILVSAPKKLVTRPDAFQPPRLLISDFGLCKRLEADQSSFRATTAHAAGTSGWRAPELLLDEDAVTNNTHSTSSAPPTTHSVGSEPLVIDTATNRRATRAIDIFSLGCVFYYVITGGNHPFDGNGKYMREANIVKGNYCLDDLACYGEDEYQTRDLIARMLQHDPRHRPDAAEVLAHPFFWSAQDRLDFLCHVSDQFEFECREPPSPALLCLEATAPLVLKECKAEDFLRALPSDFVATLGKQRKYQGGKMLDLLRALRNKKNHYEDMPDSVKVKVGSLPRGYLLFWMVRFPKLLMACHQVIVQCGWEGKDRFRKYYNVD